MRSSCALKLKAPARTPKFLWKHLHPQELYYVFEFLFTELGVVMETVTDKISQERVPFMYREGSPDYRVLSTN